MANLTNHPTLTEEDFWNRVDRHPTGCWEYMGPRLPKGYGTFGGRGLAHRYAGENCLESFDSSLHVLHSCDNPPCVRPSHLFQGTNLDNVRDMVAKGRHGHGVSPGEKNPRARLTEIQVREIRARLRAGEIRADLAREFAVNSGTLHHIASGRNWKGVE